jgi:hypothetical protein
MEASNARQSGSGRHGKRTGVEDMQQRRGLVATTMMMTMRINLCSGKNNATMTTRSNETSGGGR